MNDVKLMCQDTCSMGTLPSVSSFWNLNEDLLISLGLAKNDIFVKMNLLKQTVRALVNIEQCGTPIAIEERVYKINFSGSSTICSLHGIKLPWNLN